MWIWQGEAGGVADCVTEAAAAAQGHRVLGISGSFDSSHSDPEACAALGGRYLCLSLWVCRNSLLCMKDLCIPERQSPIDLLANYNESKSHVSWSEKTAILPLPCCPPPNPFRAAGVSGKL